MMMKTGYQNCSNSECGKRIHVKEIRFPFKDVAHDVGCPYCDETLGRVPKGVRDYIITKAEEK
jgi:hypothetical protein